MLLPTSQPSRKCALRRYCNNRLRPRVPAAPDQRAQDSQQENCQLRLRGSRAVSRRYLGTGLVISGVQQGGTDGYGWSSVVVVVTFVGSCTCWAALIFWECWLSPASTPEAGGPRRSGAGLVPIRRAVSRTAVLAQILPLKHHVSSFRSSAKTEAQPNWLEFHCI